ncbi:MAG: YdcF family protein [Clostridia bacterium]|nr:YdcF family protein [Clostridia bacterium]
MKAGRISKKALQLSAFAVSALAAAVCIYSSFAASRTRPAFAAIMLALCFACLTAILGASFIWQIRTDAYSYNTVYSVGFGLFALSLFVSHALAAINCLRAPEVYGINEIVRLLSASAQSYMLMSFPFIFISSLLLCVSNIVLIKHEGVRIVNVLGILLTAFMLGGEIFLFRFDYYVSGSQREVMLHDMASCAFAAVYLYFECMLIGAVAAELIVLRPKRLPEADFVIILGCGLRKDGSPTPLLSDRIDCALGFYKAQKQSGGKEAVFVTSGGQGADEVVSESAAMKRRLIEQGVSAEQIIEEDRSTNTLENMRFSHEKIAALRPDAQTVFATSNYHVFRSGLCARRAHMRAWGVGVRTKWYFWPNASVRELAGLLNAHKGRQALIVLTLITAFTLLTLLAYR